MTNILIQLTKFNDLPKFLINEIDSWLLKFPKKQRRSAILISLQFVQDFNGGFLTNELIEIVAVYLGVPVIFVYEVASFYSMYNSVIKTKYRVFVCTNITCSLRGSVALLNEIRKRYYVDFKNVSGDGKFLLSEVECLALCDKAPVLQLNKDYIFNASNDVVFEIFDRLE